MVGIENFQVSNVPVRVVAAALCYELVFLAAVGVKERAVVVGALRRLKSAAVIKRNRKTLEYLFRILVT